MSKLVMIVYNWVQVLQSNMLHLDSIYVVSTLKACKEILNWTLVYILTFC